jgi:hypothetical protein
MMHRYVPTSSFALFPLVCAIALVSPANGATLTQSVATSFGTTSPSSGVPVLLSQFDSSLGTLTGVTFNIAQIANNSIVLSNPTTSTQTVLGGFSYTTGYNGPGLSVTVSPTAVTTSAVLAPNESRTVVVPVPFDRTASASTLAEYVGTGSVSLSFFYAAAGFSQKVGNALTTTTFGSASGTSNLTVSYNYIPVPEPVSTAGCLAFGMLVLTRKVLRSRVSPIRNS